MSIWLLKGEKIKSSQKGREKGMESGLGSTKASLAAVTIVPLTALPITLLATPQSTKTDPHATESETENETAREGTALSLPLHTLPMKWSSVLGFDIWNVFVVSPQDLSEIHFSTTPWDLILPFPHPGILSCIQGMIHLIFYVTVFHLLSHQCI